MRHKAISCDISLGRDSSLEPTRLLDEGHIDALSGPPQPEQGQPEHGQPEPVWHDQAPAGPNQTAHPPQPPDPFVRAPAELTQYDYEQARLRELPISTAAQHQAAPEETRILPEDSFAPPVPQRIAPDSPPKPDPPLAATEADDTEECLPNGTKLLRGQYRIKRYLGAGGFGITYLAADSLEREVVIKECFPRALCYRRAGTVLVRRSADQRQFARLVAHFDAEARRLAHLSHPNIVGVHQVFADNGTAYFALDLIRGKNLQAMIGKTSTLSPAMIKGLLLTLLDALAYLHDRGILHRDIAPDNILLKSLDDPVLIDFGAARGESAPNQQRHTALTTVKDGYSPPEFYTPGSPETPASDLYSLAATFYHLIVGAAPPDALTRLGAVISGAPDPLLPLSDFDRRFDRFFIQALNRALSLTAEARPASAMEWTLEIHEARRRSAALLKARQDQQIEASISRLVAEAHNLTSANTPASGATIAPATAPPPKTQAVTNAEAEASAMAKPIDLESTGASAPILAAPVQRPLPRPLPAQFQPQHMWPKSGSTPRPSAPARPSGSRLRRIWRWLIQSRRSP